MTPDLMDSMVAQAINEIRTSANEARRRLGIVPVVYQTETSLTIHWANRYDARTSS